MSCEQVYIMLDWVETVRYYIASRASAYSLSFMNYACLTVVGHMSFDNFRLASINVSAGESFVKPYH